MNGLFYFVGCLTPAPTTSPSKCHEVFSFGGFFSFGGNDHDDPIVKIHLYLFIGFHVQLLQYLHGDGDLTFWAQGDEWHRSSPHSKK